MLWSLVHEKTVVLPSSNHTQTHTLTNIRLQCCKLTYTLILSKLFYDRGIVPFLRLPQMGLPDLRDDVIGFFECLQHLRNLGALLCRVL